MVLGCQIIGRASERGLFLFAIVKRSCLHCYDDSAKMQYMTNFENPEIRGWFVPRVTPYGSAPEHIKEQWVDVPLPIRYDRPEAPEVHVGHAVDSVLDITVMADGVSISAMDALKALRVFDRQEAADWWEKRLSPWSDLAFAVEAEDQIFPHDFMQRIMPGIEDFDRVDA